MQLFRGDFGDTFICEMRYILGKITFVVFDSLYKNLMQAMHISLQYSNAVIRFDVDIK